MERLKTPEIWKILNKAVGNKLPVYDLAYSMNGLSKDVVKDIANKIHNDLYLSKWNWRELAKNKIKNEQFKRKIKEVNI